MKLIHIFLSVLFLFSAAALAENAAPVFDVDSMSTDNNTLQQESVVKVSPGTPQAPMISSAAPQSLSPMNTESHPVKLDQQNSPQAEMQNRVNTMQNEIQSLRGQVEELTHQVQVLNDQQELMRTEGPKHANKNPVEPSMSRLPREMDEDNNVLKISKAKPAATPAEKNNAANRAITASKPAAKKIEQPNNTEEQAVYQTAYNFIKAKKYNDAIGTLQKMLIKYPSGQFAANAHYWLGELYSLTGENDQAANEFGAVVKNYPSNARVPDSELKLGLIYATQLKWPEAKTAFKKVSTKYPGTASAHLANEQLKQLKQAGH